MKLRYAIMTIRRLPCNKKYLSIAVVTAIALFILQMSVITLLYWNYVGYKELNVGIYCPGKLTAVSDNLVIYESVPFVFVTASGTLSIVIVSPFQILWIASLSMLTGIYASLVLYGRRSRSLHKIEIAQGLFSSGFGYTLLSLGLGYTLLTLDEDVSLFTYMFFKGYILFMLSSLMSITMLGIITFMFLLVGICRIARRLFHHESMLI